MEKKYIIALTLLGINNHTINELILNLDEDDLKNVFQGEFLETQFKHNIDLQKYNKQLGDKELLIKKIKEAEKIIVLSKENNIKMISINEKKYPIGLRGLEDAPPIIYFKGRGFYKRDYKAIACVGTRTPTQFGVRAVNSLVSKLAIEEFTIVSGLAKGIDEESHKTCIENGGRTIAVLAHGLDMIYPKENVELAKNILNNNGLLVSEYPIGTKPERYRFVKRNRIVSGLSNGVIIFESKEKSGTMHTVNFAKDQNKKVFCPIPLNNDEQVKGLNMLLKNNEAIGIRTKNDYDVIITELGYRIKKDKQKFKEVKDKKIYDLIKKLNIKFDDIANSEIRKPYGNSGISVDKELYQKFKYILKENNLTLKEFFNGIMLSVINAYKED